jgi:hypothetical protein
MRLDKTIISWQENEFLNQTLDSYDTHEIIQLLEDSKS